MEMVIEKESKNGLIDVAKIKRLCEEQNISLAELGRRIGLESRDLISRRLLNLYSFTADEVFLIADQLGVKADELRLI